MCGLAYDPIEKTSWVYTEYSIFEIVITKEDRNVWEMYLAKGLYEPALQYCKNPAQKDKVWTTQADYYYNTNNYRLAAVYYAKTQKSFEEVTLKFIASNEQNALKTYLTHKLENLKSNTKTKDLTQMTLIATWLTEIYLDKLNQLDVKQKDTFEALREEFEQFLKDYKVRTTSLCCSPDKDNLDKATTCNLISAHGRVEELLHFALVIEDYERVINHHIQQSQWKQALDVITGQSNEELYYKFSPILMYYIPYHTANAWLKQPNLDPHKLIPSLMRYDPANNPAEDKDVRVTSSLTRIDQSSDSIFAVLCEEEQGSCYPQLSTVLVCQGKG